MNYTWFAYQIFFTYTQSLYLIYDLHKLMLQQDFYKSSETDYKQHGPFGVQSIFVKNNPIDPL